MPSKKKRFADDGWAVWVDGDDVSTVYLNDWVNPKGKSYIDMAVRIRGVNVCKIMNVYIPYRVEKSEIEDVSVFLQNRNILRATFSAACIIDFKKNEHTSEIAYNRKTIDIVHIGTLDFQLKDVAEGTILSVSLEELLPFLDNDEVYFLWRMPHKSLDEIFKPRVDVRNAMQRLRDLIMSPVISEKYGYSIRINESRLLPEEINRIGSFHRQKLKKSVVTISINENYEMNDTGCYRIRRLEQDLYQGYLPAGYDCEDVITYQWNQKREDNYQGHFNFYYSILHNSISQISMFVYMFLLFAFGILGNFLWDILKILIGFDA